MPYAGDAVKLDDRHLFSRLCLPELSTVDSIVQQTKVCLHIFVRLQSVTEWFVEENLEKYKANVFQFMWEIVRFPNLLSGSTNVGVGVGGHGIGL